MIEILIVFTYLYFCIIKNPIWIINSLMILLPAHKTLKACLELFLGGTTIFPLWYDIGIFILLYKVIVKPHYPIRNKSTFAVFIILLFIYFFISYFADNTNGEALATLRIYLHSVGLFLALSIYKLKEEDVNCMYKTFVVSTFVYCITGLLIYFLFQQEFHLLLGHYIATSQGLKYITSSFTIMGVERMFGLIGGPNQFGMYMGIITLCVLYMNQYLNYENKYYIKVLLSLSIMCLILTFSRAGWAVVMITYCFLYTLIGKLSKIVKFSFILLIISVIILFFISLLGSDYFDIIISSFSGEESSAANREELVKEGFAEVVNFFWGNGLGTCIDSSFYYSESAMVICLYEIGIIGTVIYYYLMLDTSIYVFKSKTVYSKTIISFTLATIIASIVSMNPFQHPYIYFYWAILGMSINKGIMLQTKISYGKNRKK